MIQTSIPSVFMPLYKPARYKGAKGGRGSGKSHDRAQALVLECLKTPGTRAVCIREIQRTLSDSSKRLIEDKIISLEVGSEFTVMHDRILTPGGGQITFMGMQDSNAESVKSLEGVRIAWCEEAQTLSEHSLMLLRPTIRMEGSELWFTWNSRRKSDPIELLLGGTELPTGSVCVHANWRDNPFFPDVLEAERQDCIRLAPESYDHIWEGDFQRVLKGAYYAECITTARNAGRVSRVSADPLLPCQLFVDIGGTGARSDAFSLWVGQLVGKEVRVLDYYEAQGQPLDTHIAWIRQHGYEQARVYLPHDGVQHDRVYKVSYQSAMQDAGFDVTVIKNQGAGAAMKRVVAGRRMFPSMWFNEVTTAPGIESLSWYHEKIDVVRQIGLGPEHDFSSHAADAFGLMAIVFEEQQQANQWQGDIDYSRMDKGMRR